MNWESFGTAALADYFISWKHPPRRLRRMLAVTTINIHSPSSKRYSYPCACYEGIWSSDSTTSLTQWSTSCLARFTATESTSGIHWLRHWVGYKIGLGASGGTEKPRNLLVIKPASPSHYTDWAIPAQPSTAQSLMRTGYLQYKSLYLEPISSFYCTSWPRPWRKNSSVNAV